MPKRFDIVADEWPVATRMKATVPQLPSNSFSISPS
jgi:hypothetical protein